jgi:hypothetical protein
MTDKEKMLEMSEDILRLLKLHFPEIANRTYDSFGYPNRDGVPALDRIQMCLSIELMKAGVDFND